MSKIRKDQTNVHHLIAKSYEDEYNVHEEENKIRMNMIRHNALHSLFWVLLSPKEQLLELRNLYDTILNDTSKQLFDELLSLEDKDFYLPKLVKNGKRKRHFSRE